MRQLIGRLRRLLCSCIDLATSARVRWPMVPSILVVATALLLHASWGPGIQVAPNIDSALYLRLAENLAEGRGFVAPDRIALSVPEPGWERKPDAPTAIRTPAYPFVLSLFLRAGVSMRTLVLLQVLIHAATALAVYLFGGRSRSAFLAAVIVATWLPSVATAREVMTETLFAALVTGAFLLLWRHRLSTGAVLAAAVLLGSSTLVRPISIFLPLIAAAWIALSGRRIRLAVVLLLISSAPALVWMMRNRRLTGATVLDAIGGENALFFRAAQVLVVRDRGPLYALLAMHTESDFFRRMVRIRPSLLQMALEEIASTGTDPFRLTHAQRSQHYGRIGARITSQNPLYATLLTVNGMARLFLNAMWETSAKTVDYRTARRVLLPLSIAYLALAFTGWRELRRRDPPLAALALLFVGYFSVLPAEPAVEPRFTVAFVPMYALLIGVGADCTLSVLCAAGRPHSRAPLPPSPR